MAFDYSELDDAIALLAEFGAPAIVRHPVTTSNPASRSVTQHRPIDTTVNAILTMITEKNFPNSVIKAGDQLAICDGSLARGDRFIQDGINWQVEEVMPVKPGDTALIWKAQVRR